MPLKVGIEGMINFIASDIRTMIESDQWTTDLDNEYTSGELCTREAGTALFFVEMARRARSANDLSTARLLIDRAATRLETVPLHFGLFSGSTGTAWAINYAYKQGIFEPAEYDSCDEFDELLLAWIRTTSDVSVDIIVGLSGIGLYALTRLPRPAAKQILNTIVERLWDKSEAIVRGRAWVSSHFDSDVGGPRPTSYDGAIPIGLAHGSAGVIGFLSRVYQRLNSARARELLVEASRALPPLEFTPGKPCCPRMMDRNQQTWGVPAPSWCWGDIGVSLALIHAAKTTGDSRIRDYAMPLVMNVAHGFDGSSYVDTSLCHGLAGAVVGCSALHGLTGESTLDGRSRRFASMLLDAGSKDVTAGYTFLRSTKDRTLSRSPSSGLLAGSAGVGLALLWANGHPGPWVRLFLMDTL
jgi:hypothetical protein